MVGEPMDIEMEKLMLPAVLVPPALSDYRAVKLMVRLRGEAAEEEPAVKKSKPRERPRPDAPRNSVTDKLEVMTAERDAARAELKLLRREMAAANGAVIPKVQALEADAKKAKKARTFADRAAKLAMADADFKKEGRDAANLRIVEMKKEITRLSSYLQAKSGQLEKQVEITWKLREEKATIIKTFISPERLEEETTKYQEQLLLKTKLEDELDAARAEHEEMEEKVAEVEKECKEALDAARIDGRGSDVRAPEYLKAMSKEVGILTKYKSVPARARPADNASDWRKQSVRHIAAVLDGRGEGDDIDVVADALHRAGYLQRLTEADRFQPIAKSIAKDAVDKVQSHWTARHAVHVWDRLELSRTQMETLNQLLSFTYDPVKDFYFRIKVWINRKDPADYVTAARLAARAPREREYHSIASTMNVVVGANGRCERDAIECTSRLYTNYASALREAYTTRRPAQPVLFLDGTGGPLGRGICHGEMGCADFKKVGDSDAKQSRATLQPLFLYQGNDHAEPLRANLDLSIKSYNKLVRQGFFDRVNISTSVSERIPARPITAADMQGAKSTYGMHECSHSVWCKCRNDGAGSAHHAFTSKHMDTYSDMCQYIDKEVGCEIKTHDEMCSWAHFSPGVARGGAFTSFECSCCGYKPTEAQWRRDLATYHLKDDDEQKAAQDAHRDSDDPLNSQQQHHHQVLFMPPLPHHGMDRCGVDNLHLTYLNVFKHLFKYTVHEGLPPTKKKLVSTYLRDMKFYSYDASSLDDDPVSHWIGREVKRFLDEADKHLPFLLQIAAAPADCVAEMAACANIDGEQEMDFDPEYTPTAEQVAEEEELMPLMMQNSQRWDNFLAYVRAMAAEWPQGEVDTDEYRKGRALEAFNLGNKVAIDIHELKPTMLTWVPHIMSFIVPRQMVELGDPTRRSCDACESFGAMVKKLIKHATCRRPPTGTTKVAHGQKVEGAEDRRWAQTFKVGFIQQAFKRSCVRESLQHGEDNVPYGQRIDFQRTQAGKARAVKKFLANDSPMPAKPSIFEAATAFEAARQAAKP